MYQPIDGPNVYKSLSVTTSATELKVGASVLDDRIAILIQPINGRVYFGFSNAVTTSNGILLQKNQIFGLELGPRASIYLIAETGIVDVRIAELS